MKKLSFIKTIGKSRQIGYGVLLLITVLTVLFVGFEDNKKLTDATNVATNVTANIAHNSDASSPSTKPAAIKSDTAPQSKSLTTAEKAPVESRDNAPRSLPQITTPTQPSNPVYINPNYAIHVTKTGSKSLSWTSSYSANGYYIIFQLQGECGSIAVVLPCTTYLTESGTTSGSRVFNYASDMTLGEKALVTVCVNENVANCGMAADNYAYLDY